MPNAIQLSPRLIITICFSVQAFLYFLLIYFVPTIPFFSGMNRNCSKWHNTVPKTSLFPYRKSSKWRNNVHERRGGRTVMETGETKAYSDNIYTRTVRKIRKRICWTAILSRLRTTLPCLNAEIDGNTSQGLVSEQKNKVEKAKIDQSLRVFYQETNHWAVFIRTDQSPRRMSLCWSWEKWKSEDIVS